MSDEHDDFFTMKLPVAGELYRATAELAAKRARSVEAVALAALREHVEANGSLARDGLSQVATPERC